MAFTIGLNAFFYRRLSCRDASLEHLPKISVLIPARNEAGIIGRTLTHHLATTYPNYELILLDDNSTDATATIAAQTAGASPYFKLINGQPLPSGWLGKNWACHQLAAAATGDILIFTDADVIWQPNALKALIKQMSLTNADMLSVWPTQQTKSWGERLVVPLMAHAILAYLPLVAVHHTPFPIFAAANGQCIAIRRETYRKIGGHQAVRSNIVEDVALARAVKSAESRLRLIDGNQLISCRMYQSWHEVRDGFSKNILAGYGSSIPLLLLSTLFHWLVFVIPLLWLLLALITNAAWQLPLTLALTGIVIRAISAALTKQRVQDALLMPLSVLLMTRIAVQAIIWKSSGQTVWKGRHLDETT